MSESKIIVWYKFLLGISGAFIFILLAVGGWGLKAWFNEDAAHKNRVETFMDTSEKKDLEHSDDIGFLQEGMRRLHPELRDLIRKPTNSNTRSGKKKVLAKR